MFFTATKIVKNLIILLALVFCTISTAKAEDNPKREFRGAWIQCVNGQYLNKTPEQIRTMLLNQLDVLQGQTSFFFGAGRAPVLARGPHRRASSGFLWKAFHNRPNDKFS